MKLSAASWLGLGARRAAAAGTGGPIRHPAMDEWVRRVCAVHSDGLCLIAEGYESDRRLREALMALRRSGGMPDRLIERSASLGEIAACWRAADLEAAGGEAPAARKVRMLFEEAAAARASDVVFENDGGLCRVHGIVNDRKLRLAEPMPADEGREAMGFLFHCKDEGSAQTSYQRSAFQGFSVRAGGQVPLPATVSALRCQRGPHEPDGDHLFARLFYRDRIEKGTTLESLGFSAEEAAVFSEIRMSLRGGIFLGGTAGDGKSTTLATNLALQMEEAQGQLNVVTIEDPVEYPIPGAVQIAVPTTGSGEERGRHFRDALMHFCRVHPASGMVSEIRDADAARQVLQFIDTGHQVWTTIHVHSANAILFRLLDMGVGTAEVCKPGNIELLMKQTLLPGLCEACALERPAGGRGVPPWLGRHLSAWPRVRFRNPQGCEACSREDRGAVAGQAWNGYERQTAIAEAIRPDAPYLSFVRQRDPAGAWDHWVKRMGGRPIGERIWGLVAAGKADPFDALRKGARVNQAAAVDASPLPASGEEAA
ncbi:MAG: ATPase, T2SS/T4P/T4SS family [Alphaproteobacteria bacterium]|nr:ATPase, T2SS/T4P/T4SS family [Alphaproteobacteria bacterium]